MRLWVITVVATAVLAGAITLTAITSANGAPRGKVLSAPGVLRGDPVARLELGSCVGRQGRGASALRFDGTCRGVLRSNFTCVTSGELAALSIARPVGGGRTLYLTIMLFDYDGPGLYLDDEASAQVVGPASVPRWTSRGSRVDVRARPGGIYDVGNGVLLPEPGTPASGVITLDGRIVCR